MEEQASRPSTPPRPDSLDPARLIARRQALGFTKADLARHVGVGYQTVSAWECGEQRPYPVTLKALAQALHCRVEDLCMGPPAEAIVAESMLADEAR